MRVNQRRRWRLAIVSVLLAAPVWAQLVRESSPLAQKLELALQIQVPAIRELRIEERLGRVILRGSAPDLPTRRKAMQIVRAAQGVLRVLDLISVQPVPRRDRDIQSELLRELELRGPETSDVTVRVEKGVISLSGRLRSLDLRDEIIDVAEHIRGVRDLVSRIAVLPGLELPALRIPEDAAWLLPFDSSTVRMRRQGEIVTLRGKLLTQEQVERLVNAMLRQPGVVRVVSEIEVLNPFEKLPNLGDP